MRPSGTPTGPRARRAKPRRAAATGPDAAPSEVVPVGSLAGFGPAARYRRDLVRLAALLAARRGGPVELEVAALTDREIRAVNRRFLGHDWATDVVSFPLSPPGAARLVGALAVSRDTARREAARRGHSPYDEWMLYVVHGALHLLGHDDHAPRARARMRRAEAEVLAALDRPHVFGPAAPGRRRTRGPTPTPRTSEAR